jgi:diguanylate cyclase (GGDEF)-like protein
MVMASWPTEGNGPRQPRVSTGVRRRVDHALRLALRQALRIGAPLVALAMGADAMQLVMRFGADALPAAGADLAVAGVVVVLGVAGARGRAKPEPCVLAALVLVFGAALLNGRLLPNLEPQTAGFLAVTLVGSALFLAWSPRWHTVWLAVAGVLTAVAVGGTLVAEGDAEVAASEMMAVAAGGLVSLIGQPLAYHRTRRLLEQQFEMRHLSRVLRSQERQLAGLNQELVRTARLDAVTGIGNRRALDEALAGLAGQRLAAVLLDVDHFKSFNDRNGHLAGDSALTRIGEILREVVRKGDLVFRYGGEEFLILIPGGDREGAAGLAERIRTAVEADATSRQWGLTVSAGVAVADRFSASSPLPLLRRADAALYQAKRSGRNRVVIDEVALAAGGGLSSAS